MLILADSKDLWDIIENVDINVEKSTQISIVAKKTAIERWQQIMIMGPNKLHITINLFFCYYVYYYCYATDMIKKLELLLLVVIILFKIEFGHTQISVSIISKPMLKTVCINPCWWSLLRDHFTTRSCIESQDKAKSYNKVIQSSPWRRHYWFWFGLSKWFNT